MLTSVPSPMVVDQMLPVYNLNITAPPIILHSSIPVTTESNNASAELPERVIEASVGVSIFAITPTYARVTQKVDLTSLCYTVQYISNFIWIVVEDSDKSTSLVSSVLTHCKVSDHYMHSNMQ